MDGTALVRSVDSWINCPLTNSDVVLTLPRSIYLLMGQYNQIDLETGGGLRTPGNEIGNARVDVLVIGLLECSSDGHQVWSLNLGFGHIA